MLVKYSNFSTNAWGAFPKDQTETKRGDTRRFEIQTSTTREPRVTGKCQSLLKVPVGSSSLQWVKRLRCFWPRLNLGTHTPNTCPASVPLNLCWFKAIFAFKRCESLTLPWPGASCLHQTSISRRRSRQNPGVTFQELIANPVPANFYFPPSTSPPQHPRVWTRTVTAGGGSPRSRHHCPGQGWEQPPRTFPPGAAPSQGTRRAGRDESCLPSSAFPPGS